MNDSKPPMAPTSLILPLAWPAGKQRAVRCSLLFALELEVHSPAPTLVHNMTVS